MNCVLGFETAAGNDAPERVWVDAPGCHRISATCKDEPLAVMHDLRPRRGARLVLFGAAIGLIACYYGLNPHGNSINAVPKAAISAVTQATLAVMLLNVLFAYLVYGSALFGLFTADQ